MSELSNETTFMQKKSFLTILEPQTCFWIFAIFGQNLELFFKQRFCKRLKFFFFSEFENRTSQLLPVVSLVKKYLKLAAVRPKEDRSQNRPILGHFRTNSTFSNRQVYCFFLLLDFYESEICCKGVSELFKTFFKNEVGQRPC